MSFTPHTYLSRRESRDADGAATGRDGDRSWRVDQSV